MLSILIPTYNYDCRQLVSDLHGQCISLDVPFEIRVYDDHSTDPIKKEESSEVQYLFSVVYKVLPENVGFCKIRNLLAEEAQYDHLLFLDADIKIDEGFIQHYLNDLTTDAQSGGIQYLAQQPFDKTLYLKWKHGKEREELSPAQRQKHPYRTISAANIFIKKKVYLKAKMDEEAIGYGYNDTMLGYNLKLISASIKHIENPVLHEGLMSADKFIHRSMEAMENLLFFEKQPYIQSDFHAFIKILNLYTLLFKTRLSKWFLAHYRSNKDKWIINLKSEHPSLRNLDKLKLGRLIELKMNR